MSTNVEARRGRLEALQRLATEGAAKGWHRVPGLLHLLARIAGNDLSAGPLDDFTFGWDLAVVEVIDHICEDGIAGLADLVRRRVLAAALAVEASTA